MACSQSHMISQILIHLAIDTLDNLQKSVDKVKSRAVLKLVPDVHESKTD